jgi:hypothetical protein
MAKHFESQTVFNFNLEQLLQGFWRRYPNPYSLHVLTEDTVEREIRPDGSLFSKRLLTKTNKLPKWAERVFSHVKQVCIIEESVVDMKSRTLTTYTRNVGLNKIMVRIKDKQMALTDFLNSHCRVSSKKWSIRVIVRDIRQWHIDQRGLIRKFLVSQLQFELSVPRDSRKIAISR